MLRAKSEYSGDYCTPLSVEHILGCLVEAIVRHALGLRDLSLIPLFVHCDGVIARYFAKYHQKGL
jgi:hypothetical protein